MKAGSCVEVDKETCTVTREYSWKWQKIAKGDAAFYVRCSESVLISEAAAEAVEEGK